MPRQQMRFEETDERTNSKDGGGGGSRGVARAHDCAGSAAECDELALYIQKAAEAAFITVKAALKPSVSNDTLARMVADGVRKAVKAAPAGQKQPIAVAVVSAAVRTAVREDAPADKLGLVVFSAVGGAMQAASTDEKQAMAVAVISAMVRAAVQEDVPTDKLSGVVGIAVGRAVATAPAGQKQPMAVAVVNAIVEAVVEEGIPKDTLTCAVLNAMLGAMSAVFIDEKQPIAGAAASAAVRAAVQKNIPKDKLGHAVVNAVLRAVEAAPAGQEQLIAVTVVNAAMRAAVQADAPEDKLRQVVSSAAAGAVKAAPAGQEQAMAVAVISAMVRAAVEENMRGDKLGLVGTNAVLGTMEAAPADQKQSMAVAVINAVETALKACATLNERAYVFCNALSRAVRAVPVDQQPAVTVALAPLNPISLARYIQIQAIKLPVTLSSAERKSFYSTYLPLNYIVVVTHVFSLPETQFAFDQKQTARSTPGNGEQFSGESSYGNLMLDEFKASFSRYQQFARSLKVDGLMSYVHRFASISDMEIDHIQLGKWQPILIVVEITLGTGHAISLLTDGRALFWVDSGQLGMEVVLIKRELDQVKAVLRDLKDEAKSPRDVREALSALLQDESDAGKYIEYVVIPMPSQTIDNCGWAQAAGMLKALVVAPVVRYFSLQGKLPVTNSKKWRKALKDADDIYEGWQKFDQTVRLEAMTCLADQTECNPILLNEADQAELERQRGLVDGKPIIGQQLLERIAKAAAKLDADPACLRLGYKESVHASARSLALLAALGSEMGQTLQKAAEASHVALGEAAAPNPLGDGRSAAKALLRQCQNHDVSFDYLSAVHQEISLGQFSQHVAPLLAASVELACAKQATKEQVEAYLTAVSERCAAVTEVGTSFEKCVKEQAALIEASHTSTMHGHGGAPNQDVQPGATLGANEPAPCAAGISAAAGYGLAGQVNETSADKF